MLTRNKKLKDYGIPAEDIEKMNTMLKDFPAEYGYLLSGAALSQRKIYPDEPERLLWIQTQDRRCTV